LLRAYLCTCASGGLGGPKGRGVADSWLRTPQQMPYQFLYQFLMSDSSSPGHSHAAVVSIEEASSRQAPCPILRPIFPWCTAECQL